MELPRKGRYVNVVMHIFGYFSKELTSDEKALLLDNINLYTESRIPLSTVIGILKSWVYRFNNEYLKKQTIFNPFPIELIKVTDSGKGLSG